MTGAQERRNSEANDFLCKEREQQYRRPDFRSQIAAASPRGPMASLGYQQSRYVRRYSLRRAEENDAIAKLMVRDVFDDTLNAIMYYGEESHGEQSPETEGSVRDPIGTGDGPEEKAAMASALNAVEDAKHAGFSTAKPLASRVPDSYKNHNVDD